MDAYIKTFITDEMVEHAKKASELRDSYAKLSISRDTDACRLLRDKFEAHECTLGMLLAQDIMRELAKEKEADEVELLTKVEEA